MDTDIDLPYDFMSSPGTHEVNEVQLSESVLSLRDEVPQVILSWTEVR